MAGSAEQKKVLVVDDNRDCRDSLAAVFEAHEYEVLTASNGLEALSVARAARPEIVVTDLGMPSMDGISFCAALRKDPLLRNACIIAMSGWDHRMAHHSQVEACFDAHFVKPADLDELLGVVSRACEKKVLVPG